MILSWEWEAVRVSGQWSIIFKYQVPNLEYCHLAFCDFRTEPRYWDYQQVQNLELFSIFLYCIWTRLVSKCGLHTAHLLSHLYCARYAISDGIFSPRGWINLSIPAISEDQAWVREIMVRVFFCFLLLLHKGCGHSTLLVQLLIISCSCCFTTQQL